MTAAESPLPDGYTVRAPTAFDAEAVVALIRACELADEGDAELTLDDLQGNWERPNFTLATDAWLVADEGGAPAAYADLWERTPGALYTADGYVHPDHRARGLGAHLVDLFEGRATELAAGRPASLQTIVFHPIEDARRLLESRGYEPNRFYWRMVIDMDEPPPEPRFPDGITWRTFRDGDEAEVHAVVQETFADIEGQVYSPFEEWQHFMMRGESFDPTLWFLAMDGHAYRGRRPLAPLSRPRLDPPGRRPPRVPPPRHRPRPAPHRFPRALSPAASAGSASSSTPGTAPTRRPSTSAPACTSTASTTSTQSS